MGEPIRNSPDSRHDCRAHDQGRLHSFRQIQAAIVRAAKDGQASGQIENAKLLVFARRDDLHADAVIWHARRLGASTLRVSVDDLINGDCHVSFKVIGSHVTWSISDGRTVFKETDDFVVFCRDYDVPFTSSRDDLNLCVLFEEVRALLAAFASLSGINRWIDHPELRERFDNKIYQIAVAGGYGLAVPDTLVTRIHKDASYFFDGGPSVVKQISPFGLVGLEEQEEGIYTSPVVAPLPSGAIEACPTYFQRQIAKTSDVRITAIDDTIFAHEILPVEGEREIVDFRQRRGEIVQPFDVPESTRSSIRRMMLGEGIRFACFDFGEEAKASDAAGEESRREALHLKLGRCGDLLTRLTDAFLDGSIDKETFDARKTQLLEERRSLQDAIEEGVAEGPATSLLKKLELGNTAYLQFQSEFIDEKREGAKIVLSNLIADGKSLAFRLRNPFDVIAKQRISSYGAR